MGKKSINSRSYCNRLAFSVVIVHPETLSICVRIHNHVVVTFFSAVPNEKTCNIYYWKSDKLKAGNENTITYANDKSIVNLLVAVVPIPRRYDLLQTLVCIGLCVTVKVTVESNTFAATYSAACLYGIPINVGLSVSVYISIPVPRM